jgi:UDPglucose 6-dehydrogenase
MLLAQHNEVIAVDIIEEKVNLLNNKKSSISDVEIEDLLFNKSLNFEATLDKVYGYKNADYVVIATAQIMTLKPIMLIHLLLK